MSKIIAINVPDIGNFKDIPVIEILVKVGDTVTAEQSLVTLETDKATMDVPAPVAGVVKELKVKVGDTVSEGSVILMLENEGQDQGSRIKDQVKTGPELVEVAGAGAGVAQSSILDPRSSFLHAEVLVLGAGPGGYTAAFQIGRAHV